MTMARRQESKKTRHMVAGGYNFKNVFSKSLGIITDAKLHQSTEYGNRSMYLKEKLIL